MQFKSHVAFFSFREANERDLKGLLASAFFTPALCGSQGRCGSFPLRDAKRHSLVRFLLASLQISALRGLCVTNRHISCFSRKIASPASHAAIVRSATALTAGVSSTATAYRFGIATSFASI